MQNFTTNTQTVKIEELGALIADEQNRCDYLDGVLKDLRWWAGLQNIALPEYANCQESMIGWHMRREKIKAALGNAIGLTVSEVAA